MTYQIVSERKAAEYKISHPGDAYDVIQRYAKKKQEHFLVVSLNGAHKVISVKIITIGILNRTIVHPREVFRLAISENAAAIVIAHNHPSGELIPSQEDREITQRLVSAGCIIGITVLDHLIISPKGYYSFLEQSEMPS
jgi:DNA repair protein RadC